MTRLCLPLILLVGCTEADPPTDATGASSCLDADGDGVCDGAGIDWSAEATLTPGEPRTNPYGLSDDDLLAVVTEGYGYASAWPVEVSGALLPDTAMRTFLDPDDDDPDRAAFRNVARSTLGFGTLPEMYDWLGLVPYNDDGAAPLTSQWTPRPDDVGPDDPMGVGRVMTEHGEAMTFSCFTCHAGEMFGHTIVGLTNRQARANEFFHLAKTFYPSIPAETFGDLADASEDDLALFTYTQGHLGAVGSKPPAVWGLDTSLAQVALSLARRDLDPYATRNPDLERAPRDNALQTFVADSKPAVWWTLKHKTRWLSDGSIVSGNPIFTNFLWNELGRGTDLDRLEGWMDDNLDAIDALTAAVMATPAPRWVDVVGEQGLDVDAAMRGQDLFDAHCAECHGTYDKAWDTLPDDAPLAERIATTRVAYHAQTPVMDVGTDPQRAGGMIHFADRLNELAISGWMGTVVEPQQGYVPPPLEGVWSRYPYLHNQSVPTLCDLLTLPEERTEVFWMGPADDVETDFDLDCVGYPTGEAVPAAWKEADGARFDTTLPGLSSGGHDAMLRGPDGEPILSADDQSDLIAFLKTL